MVSEFFQDRTFFELFNILMETFSPGYSLLSLYLEADDWKNRRKVIRMPSYPYVRLNRCKVKNLRKKIDSYIRLEVQCMGEMSVTTRNKEQVRRDICLIKRFVNQLSDFHHGILDRGLIEINRNLYNQHRSYGEHFKRHSLMYENTIKHIYNMRVEIIKQNTRALDKATEKIFPKDILRIIIELAEPLN